MPILTQDTITSLQLFDGISSRTIEQLVTIGRIQTFKSGTHIFTEKDVLNCFYIVLSGTVCLYKTNSNGHLKTIFIFGEGSLLNETLFDTVPAAINAKAHQETTVLAFYTSDFIPLIQQDALLMQNLFDHLSKRIRRLYRQLKNATSVIKIEKKLAAKLWKLAQDYGVPHEDGILIDFPITITALSDLMGSYRETISRAIKLLVTQGLIQYEQKYIYVPDPSKLSAYFKSP